MNETTEYLKCCGNCYYFKYRWQKIKSPMFCKLKQTDVNASGCCDEWDSDRNATN